MACSNGTVSVVLLSQEPQRMSSTFACCKTFCWTETQSLAAPSVLECSLAKPLSSVGRRMPQSMTCRLHWHAAACLRL